MKINGIDSTLDITEERISEFVDRNIKSPKWMIDNRIAFPVPFCLMRYNLIKVHCIWKT